MDLNSKLLSAATAWKEAHENFMASVETYGETSEQAEQACGRLADAEDALKDAIEDAPTEAMFTSNLLFAHCAGSA